MAQEFTKEEAQVKGANKTQLAALYGISVKTFNLWIEKIKDKLDNHKSNIFTPAEVKLIFRHLEEPELL